MEIKHIYTIDQIRKISNRRITELKSTMFLRALLNSFLDMLIIGGIIFMGMSLFISELDRSTNGWASNLQYTNPDSDYFDFDPIVMLYWLIGIYVVVLALNYYFGNRNSWDPMDRLLMMYRAQKITRSDRYKKLFDLADNAKIAFNYQNEVDIYITNILFNEANSNNILGFKDHDHVMLFVNQPVIDNLNYYELEALIMLTMVQTLSNYNQYLFTDGLARRYAPYLLHFNSFQKHSRLLSLELIKYALEQTQNEDAFLSMLKKIDYENDYLNDYAGYNNLWANPVQMHFLGRVNQFCIIKEAYFGNIRANHSLKLSAAESYAILNSNDSQLTKKLINKKVDHSVPEDVDDRY